VNPLMDHCLLLLDDPCWLSTSSTEQSSGLLAEFRVEVVASRCSRFAFHLSLPLTLHSHLLVTLLICQTLHLLNHHHL